jgi:serine/threonine protein kinase/formylglycine-generating enzyme required for sulfatase activity
LFVGILLVQKLDGEYLKKDISCFRMANPNYPCPPQHFLIGFVAQSLSESKSNELQEHLEHCPACRAFVVILKAQQDAKNEILQRAKNPGFDLSWDSLRNQTEPSANREPIDPRLSRTESPERFSEDRRVPKSIAEFEIRAKLGEGGFGAVYLAYDEMLQREVALKVPHREATSAEGVEAYLREARAIASLDHPNILPVYQAARSPEVSFYIVTKLIVGTTLDGWAQANSPNFVQISAMIAKTASALGYAHTHGVVHRDVKPGNILVDQKGRPYVADFGLALREVDVDSGPEYVGTPAYMSPEQARGEGHRVDGRSDIFSLGIVLYKLLCNAMPFQGENKREIFVEITTKEPEHPSRHDPNIPKELARICMRALAKPTSERYQNILDMEADLLEFLKTKLHKSPQAARSTQRASKTTGKAELEQTLAAKSGQTDTSGNTPDSGSSVQHSPVVPKGLRPFESRDSDFFMRLLPGPYDRFGMPESIRFWKAKLESRRDEDTFSVGVMYGPSGCGKTSLVRAGLLPRLSGDVIPIYVEATGNGTEKAILHAITSLIEIPKTIFDNKADGNVEQDLPRVFAWLRRQSRKKVIIVVDQFEQWLFSHSSTLEQSGLTQALRQCDGAQLQCLLMVRDDFWMSVTRLMRALDLTISENKNASSVDLFDTKHARHVLALFGASFGKLPEEEEKISARGNKFLDAAVEYLAVDDRVICVQLALLAEMMRHREWDDSSILSKDSGAGLGVAFLANTFDLESSPRRFKTHVDGAQRVLRCLLPEPGAKIKGAVRSESVLREAAAYPDPASFRELLRILDSELHLITPTDRSDHKSFSTSDSSASSSSSDIGYQLTHDFLIAPVRRWLELRRMETRSGQAQSRLEEFADLYRARPGIYSLPGLTEYLNIRHRLPSSVWTESQKRMMQAAGSHHLRSAAKVLIALVAFVAIGATIWNFVARQQRLQLAQAKVDRLLVATFPEAMEQAKEFRADVPDLIELLRKKFSEPGLDESKNARAALVLATSDDSAKGALLKYLQTAPTHDVVIVSQSPWFSQLVNLPVIESMWKSESINEPEQLRLACMLAQQSQTQSLVLENPERLIKLLSNENPLLVSEWIQGFQPIGKQLLPSLTESFLAYLEEPGSKVLNTANLIANYGAQESRLIAELVAKSNPSGFRVLIGALGNPSGIAAVESELQKLTEPPSPNDYWIPDAEGVDWWNGEFDTKLPQESGLAADADLQQQIQSAGGFVDENFVLVQRLESDGFQSLADRLLPFGYRVAAITPFPTRDGVKIMAVWKRDGRQSVFTIKANAEELRELQAEYAKKNYFADQFCAYSADDYDTNSYACVWTTTPPFSFVEESGMYVEIAAADHENLGWRTFMERGFLPRANLLTMDGNGIEGFSSIRWRLKEGFRFHDQWNQPREWFDKTRQWTLDSNLMQGVLGTRPPHDSQRGLTVIWWSGLPIESKWLEYQSVEDHRRNCQSMQAQGYRPFGIHASQIGNNETTLFSSLWYRPQTNLVVKTNKVREQTRLAIALHELGKSDEVMAALSSTTDADFRASVIDGFSRYNVAPTWLIEQLAIAEDIVLRRAAAQALALYRPSQLAEQVQGELLDKWPALLSSVQDSGLKSALIALGKAWGMATDFDKPGPNEMITAENQRMIILEPKGFQLMGSPANEPGRDGGQEVRFPVKITERFAIAAREISIEEYLRHRKSVSYPEDYSPTKDCPMIAINWFDAARYCRWLSELEGMPETEMCFPVEAEIKPGMTFPNDYLSRTGYRLPTEAEWEFAARGGYESGRHFGFDPELLDHYAYTAQNSGYRNRPIGALLPNDYGLFDILGNAMEWCQNRMDPYPWPSAEIERDPALNYLSVAAEDLIATRGGAVMYQPLDARAGHRDDHYANSNRIYLSFRIARTLPK